MKEYEFSRPMSFLDLGPRLSRYEKLIEKEWTGTGSAKSQIQLFPASGGGFKETYTIVCLNYEHDLLWQDQTLHLKLYHEDESETLYTCL